MILQDRKSEIKKLFFDVNARGKKRTKETTSARRIGRNLMTRITRLTGKRFDHFAKLMHMTKQTLTNKNKRLQILNKETQTSFKIIGVMTEEIHMAMINLYEINSIYMALHELSKGRLSHHLTNSTLLTARIKDMSKNFERTKI